MTIGTVKSAISGLTAIAAVCALAVPGAAEAAEDGRAALGAPKPQHAAPAPTAWGLPSEPPADGLPAEPALGVAASAAVFDELRYRINNLEARIEALEAQAGIEPAEDLPPMQYQDPDFQAGE